MDRRGTTPSCILLYCETLKLRACLVDLVMMAVVYARIESSQPYTMMKVLEARVAIHHIASLINYQLL